MREKAKLKESDFFDFEKDQISFSSVMKYKFKKIRRVNLIIDLSIQYSIFEKLYLYIIIYYYINYFLPSFLSFKETISQCFKAPIKASCKCNNQSQYFSSYNIISSKK